MECKFISVDLDNTIFCDTEPLATDSGICVAHKNGKKASFMTGVSYDKFVKICDYYDILPVTTRCLASYNNIYLKKYFKDALVENGAVLISNNKDEMESWLLESRSIISNDKKDFDNIRSIIEGYGYNEKWPEDSEFVLDYTHPDITDEIKFQIRKQLCVYDNFEIVLGNSSIVVVYKKLSKGECIKRYAKKYEKEIFIVAGDSKLDHSMFKESFISIGKEDANFNFMTSNKLDFCNFVVKTLYKLTVEW